MNFAIDVGVAEADIGEHAIVERQQALALPPHFKRLAQAAKHGQTRLRLSTSGRGLDIGGGIVRGVKCGHGVAHFIFYFTGLAAGSGPQANPEAF